MDTRFFMTQDSAGERQRVRILAGGDSQGVPGHHPDRYALDDGSPVHRVDNETFRVVGTGAYITLVRD